MKSHPKTTNKRRRRRARSLTETVRSWCARLIPKAELPEFRRLDLAQLEDRVLFSAAPIGEALPDAAEMPDVNAADLFDLAAQLVESMDTVDSPTILDVLPEAENDSVEATTAEADAIDDANDTAYAPGSEPDVDRSEIVFVDAGVEDYEAFIRDIQQQSGTASLEVVLLSQDESGIARITTTLAERHGIDAIHIVSHGSANGVQLGSDWLTADNVNRYSWQIGEWQYSLDDGADLLIYGCELASSESGQELLQSLGGLCDCDVAASDDDTGHEDLGGDWVFEYAAGAIEADVAFSEHLQAGWLSVLDIATFQEGSAGYSSTLDTEVDSNAPSTNHGSNVEIEVDGSPNRQSLIRFEDLVGIGVGQIPIGSTINSATLTVDVNNATLFGNIDLHRVLVNWDESSTWNSLSGGISLDDVDAESIREDRLSNPDQTGSQTFVDLVSTVQNWVDGGANYGWVIVNDDGDSWRFASSEDVTVGDRPLLTVDYTPPGVETTLRVNAEVIEVQETAETGGSATARADNGNSVVVWSSTRQDNGTENKFGVYAQLYDETGARISEEILVNTYVSKDQRNPAVAMDDAGNFVVTWESEDQDGDQFGVYMQRFDSTGATLGGETPVNTETANDQINSAIAMDNDGDFVIVWQSDDQDGDGWGVYGQRFDSSGTMVGSEFLVNTGTFVRSIRSRRWP